MKIKGYTIVGATDVCRVDSKDEAIKIVKDKQYIAQHYGAGGEPPTAEMWKGIKRNLDNELTPDFTLKISKRGGYSWSKN
jgi:hypothetical protein